MRTKKPGPTMCPSVPEPSACYAQAPRDLGWRILRSLESAKRAAEYSQAKSHLLTRLRERVTWAAQDYVERVELDYPQGWRDMAYDRMAHRIKLLNWAVDWLYATPGETEGGEQ